MYNSNNNSGGDGSSVVSDSAHSGTSVSSTHRHHQGGPFMPHSSPQQQQQHHFFPVAVASPQPPQPVLVKDAQHKPKTTGSVGILMVGLGGANGTTLLAGVLANRLDIHWHGPTGEPRKPNYYGCITQLNMRGGGVGYKDRVKGLANVSLAAIGGWDIRPTKPGDALLQAQILDYDLVRQVRDEMNKVKVFRGVYDARFIGSSQHATATHILTKQEAPTDSEALKCLRADIRYFKWRNGVVGHTTVIWTASVEPNCELLGQYTTARDLLDAIELSEEERGGPLPPSLLYATAALLEGCSFVNGGSQNTVQCPGLADLARQQLGVYCLGTDFKAGQTKFKTAAVEYLRTMGLKPTVIASSNHLGNNDMFNLATAKTASTAKLRVKHDIFAPWQEDELDHKVSIMYTPFINDDKRDFVEYTSQGFLGQIHTMVTYTRASDSVLCVPLMVDSAVWLDYFSGKSWPYGKVAQALAYLFKVPEGAAKGVDPGFFCQMRALETQVMAAGAASAGPVGSVGAVGGGNGGLKREPSMKKNRRVRIRPDEKTTEWAIPHDARIICAGLACVDMQLCAATGGGGGEAIETFQGEKSIGGGSVSMACKTLARLCHGAPLDQETYMQVTPPVVHSVVPLCKVGQDSTGEKLIALLEASGEQCRNVETKYIKNARSKDSNRLLRTALAVLPIYQDGRRGCFFDAASNASFSARDMVEMMTSLSSTPGASSNPLLDTSHLSNDDFENYQADLEQMTPLYGAFLFGYPHLLPRMQGEALAQILLEARSCMVEGGVIALDLNGVPEDAYVPSSTRHSLDTLRSVSELKTDSVLGPALEHVDILHMNEDELCLLTGCQLQGGGTPQDEEDDEFMIMDAMQRFLSCGVAICAVTRGKRGSIVRCNNAERFRRRPTLPESWADGTANVPAVALPENTVINTNGAGDAFTAGLLVATMLRHTGMTVPSQTKQSGGAAAAGIPTDVTASAQSQMAAASSDASQRGAASSPRKPRKKLTPYTLYMRENYVSLKAQLHGDKKAIFSRCHEMWENEEDDVKALYERRAMEENEDLEDAEDASEVSLSVMDDLEKLDSTPHGSRQALHYHNVDHARNMYMTNRSLNLESAVHFASLVAAHHVNVETRDKIHVDVTELLERSIVVPTGLEEI